VALFQRNNIGWGSVYLIDDVVDGIVETFADLSTIDPLFVGDIYLVKTTTGVIAINRKQKGLYRWNGETWDLIDTNAWLFSGLQQRRHRYTSKHCRGCYKGSK